MPLYRNTITGNEAELSSSYVAAFPSHVFELVREHTDREQERLDAAEKKVDADTDEEAAGPAPHRRKKGGK